MKQVLEDEGRLWVREALNEHDLNLLVKISKSEAVAGRRLGWTDKLAKAAGTSSKLNDLAQTILPNAKPVRFVSFNKSSGLNWSLPWHQDRVIAVNDKADVKGFKNWSQKAGLWHCEPPIKILEKMIFARVHLDDSDENNGCLEVLVGSHKYGKIISSDIEKIVAELPKEACIANRGDVLFVKALTLHRSHASYSQSSRRALRVDYSNRDLPHPLAWQY